MQRVGTYLGALARGTSAEEALKIANSVFQNAESGADAVMAAAVGRHLLQVNVLTLLCLAWPLLYLTQVSIIG